MSWGKTRLQLPSGYRITSDLEGGTGMGDESLVFTLWRWQAPKRRWLRREKPATWCIVTKERGGWNRDTHGAEDKLVRLAIDTERNET